MRSRQRKSRYKNERVFNTLSSFSANGTSTKMIIDSSSFDFSGALAITFSIRIKELLASSGTYQILGKLGSFRISYDKNGNGANAPQRLSFHITRGNGQERTVTSTIDLGQEWHFIACIFQAGQLQIWTDRGIDNTRNISESNLINTANDIALFATEANTNYAPVEMAHLAFFNIAPTVLQLRYLHSKKGNVLNSGLGANLQDYYTLQYNSFKRQLTFTNNTPAVPTNINQANHGFLLNTAVVNDGGIYRAAVFSDVDLGLQIEIVTLVIDANSFNASVSGQWPANFGYGSNVLLYLQDNGQLSPLPNEYPIAIDVDRTTAQIGVTSSQIVAISSLTQANFLKASFALLSAATHLSGNNPANETARAR